MSRNYTFDNEENILVHFRESDLQPLAFPQSTDVWNVYQSIYNEKEWKKWINSSKKSNNPPDFYNVARKPMMEVMRFDDNAHKNGKVNATKARENKLLNELREKGILSMFPNLKQVHFNADAGLDTTNDHNFDRYRKNFMRVVSNHAKKVDLYRDNHKGYKLIFFVFDESSGIYCETGEKENITFGSQVAARPHFYWADDEIVSVIKKCKADYLVWYKPYNTFGTSFGTIDDFPKLIIYDVNKMEVETESYNKDLMVSTEI